MSRFIVALHFDHGQPSRQPDPGKGRTDQPSPAARDQHLHLLLCRDWTSSKALGLALEKPWAEYLTLIVTACFLPWEIFEIIRHVTWLKIVILLLNIVVVIYLVFHVQGQNPRARRA